ncbi:hypothetical protein OEZ86_005489 [Tetradesmus obliquus]|nr:hypothetical protein OEZ86_005489 [Tetradesmus obliquus]
MSDHGYDEDFEEYSEEGFESDNELEAPQQHVEQEEYTLVQQPTVSIAGVSADAWPSLTAGQLARGGSQKRSSTATFSRSLFGGPASTHPSQQQENSASGTFTVSPAAPPLTDSQRARASKALARSLQLRQQRKLSCSPQLELLVVQPLSTYQQYAQGVGAFAHARIGTCQTGQLDQDLHEQDAQTEEVRPSGRCTDSCDGAAWIVPAHVFSFRYALMR